METDGGTRGQNCQVRGNYIPGKGQMGPSGAASGAESHTGGWRLWKDPGIHFLCLRFRIEKEKERNRKKIAREAKRKKNRQRGKKRERDKEKERLSKRKQEREKGKDQKKK